MKLCSRLAGAAAFAALLPLIAAGGCASGGRSAATAATPEQLNTPEARYAAEGEKIKVEPVAYLRKVFASVDALNHYNLMFYRQERLGGKLRPMEEIRATFRKTPFSVKFVWEDPDADYFESVYVEGQNRGRLIIRERKGALPLLPPTIRQLKPMEPVKLGRARNPITDFGLAQITRRTILPFDDPAVRSQMTIRYEGLVNLDPRNRPAHLLRIERPPMPGMQYTRQDFFIDAETLLPAGTDLYLPGGDLDARYRYADVDPQVQTTDADFRLSKNHPDD